MKKVHCILRIGCYHAVMIFIALLLGLVTDWLTSGWVMLLIHQSYSTAHCCNSPYAE